MLEEAKTRTQNLQKRMSENGIRKAIFTDESSIASTKLGAGPQGCIG